MKHEKGVKETGTHFRFKNAAFSPSLILSPLFNCLVVIIKKDRRTNDHCKNKRRKHKRA